MVNRLIQCYVNDQKINIKYREFMISLYEKKEKLIFIEN